MPCSQLIFWLSVLKMCAPLALSKPLTYQTARGVPLNGQLF